MSCESLIVKSKSFFAFYFLTVGNRGGCLFTLLDVKRCGWRWMGGEERRVTARRERWAGFGGGTRNPQQTSIFKRVRVSSSTPGMRLARERNKMLIVPPSHHSCRSARLYGTCQCSSLRLSSATKFSVEVTHRDRISWFYDESWIEVVKEPLTHLTGYDRA